MLRFNSNITLPNGAIAKSLVVGMMTITSKSISITLDGFVSKEIANKAYEKQLALEKQNELVAEFTALSVPTELDDDRRSRLQKIQVEVNQLADSIANMANYEDLVIFGKTYTIPFADEISNEYILSELKKIEELKDITIDEGGE